MMDYQDQTDETLLQTLEKIGRTPPLKLIRVCLERQESLTPGLLAMFRASLDDDWSDVDDPRWYRLVHAGRLLLAYREPAALPIFEALFTATTDDQLDMLEWFETDLAYYGGTAVPMLLRITQLDTDGEYHYGRGTATDTLAHIAANYPAEKPGIVAALRAQLPPLKPDGDVDAPPDFLDEQWTAVAMALGQLQDQESRPQIEALFRQDLIEESMISYEDYESDVESDSPRAFLQLAPYDILKEYQALHHQRKSEDTRALRKDLLRDQGLMPPLPAPEPTRNRLSDWVNTKLVKTPATHAPQAQKVGRNDPCPCGSGLKYKKCHGKPGAPPL